MKRAENERFSWWPRLGFYVFLLPFAFGFYFRNAGSGNADVPHYRKMIMRLEELGAIPLVPLEWFHPGHYLAVWPIHRFEQLFGGSADPASAIGTLNLLLFSWAAFEIYRAWKKLEPNGDPAVALAPAMVFATAPGWVWLAQDAMSDVSGSALVIIACTRAVGMVRQRRDLVRGSIWVGLVFGLALTFRISSIGFAPLVVMLLFRGTRYGGSSLHRLSARLAFIAATFLPWLLVLLHLIFVYGRVDTWSTLTSTSGDNSITAARFGQFFFLMKNWLYSWWRIIGPVGALCVAGGWLVVSLTLGRRLAARFASGKGGFIDSLLEERDPRRPLRKRPFWSREGMFLLGMAALFPYVVAVFFNRSGQELRYQLPVTFFLMMPVGVLSSWLARKGYIGSLRAGVLLLVAVNLGLQWQTMAELKARRPFLPEGARATVAAAPERAIFLGQIGRSWLELEARGRIVLSVKPKEVDPGHRDSNWARLIEYLKLAHGQGASAMAFNEMGLHGFRAHLRNLGWRERIVDRVSSYVLRNRIDATWAYIHREAIEVRRDLVVFEFLPPAIDLEIKDQQGGFRAQIEAPRFAGRDYRLLLGLSRPDLALEERAAQGVIVLPFHPTDSLLAASLGDSREWGVVGLHGKLDAEGRAEVLIPETLRAVLQGATALIVVYEEKQSGEGDGVRTPDEVEFRSEFIPIPR